jgi:N-acetylglutamate synthase-like GNAT family acetyltransferase
VQVNDLSSDIQISWYGENEIEWVNEEYKKIDFKFSNLKTDQIAIATKKGKYAGLGRMCQIEDTVNELGGMHVHPNYRGLGIVRQIVKFLLSSKITGSTIYCLPFGHLQGFYESEGFKEVSKEDIAKVPKEILEKHRWCNETYPHRALLLKLNR